MIIKNPSSTISFGSKAETLERLRPHLHSAVIDPLYFFTVQEWNNDRASIVKKIHSFLGDHPLVVRSSAIDEDGLNQSNAGHYTSTLNIPAQDTQKLESAVDATITSYTDNRADHQVFAQPFLNSVEMSGVIFTRDINSFASYVTINYDDESGRTDTVTNGSNNRSKTFIFLKERCYELTDERFRRLLDVVEELERLFENDALDIEFAVRNNAIHVLQVRPIVRKHNAIDVPDATRLRTTLQQIYDRIKELATPHPDLYGKETLYGIMPDWNPAEMIGIKPRPLALSLYRELITDNVWAYQRDNYGYKRLRSFPLLVSFAGHPYIDVRVDFNSFIPKAIPDELSHRLTDFYLQKLQASPASHDKIEFDIVYSCYTFDLPNRMTELLQHGFTTEDINLITNSLRQLTLGIIGNDDTPGLYTTDLERIHTLDGRRETLLASPLSDINKIYWLIEDCKRYGTLPFAGIARAGFVAMSLLQSMVTCGILTSEEKQRFLNSLHTITRQLNVDTRALNAERMSHQEFLKKYGHLRPGTYDITLGNYSEQFDTYFQRTPSTTTNTNDLHPQTFHLTDVQTGAIRMLLDEHSLPMSVEHLFQFIREAIEGREYAKFAFTKNVSQVLTLIKGYGKQMNLDSEQLSFTEIGTFLRFYSTVAYFDEQDVLTAEIERNQKMYHLYKVLKLPHLICKPEDVFAFHVGTMEPNYITQTIAEGDIHVLRSTDTPEMLHGKITCIESADPGFDWIFSHNIAGLITTYGGANSHMAIRAAELNIPAVIGCGPLLFEQWSHERRIRLDAATRRVIPLL
ncbi:phosphoenolpyruvate synthase [Patescibacteria group bacterium]|nr:phosphoenolpyruvate synthase [Patescibacteria group bacterium]